MKSQRAYVEHVIECIRRVREDSAGGREAGFASRMLQDAILRNLQILCESTQRIEERYKQEHSEIPWLAIAGMRNCRSTITSRWTLRRRGGSQNAIPPLERAMGMILAELPET